MRNRFAVITVAAAAFASTAAAGAAPVSIENVSSGDGPLQPVGVAAAEFLPAASERPSIYVVELSQAPLATFAGGEVGYKATSPSVTGAVRLDTSDAAARAYATYLESRQAILAADMEAELGRKVPILYRYHNVLNGIATRLSPQEASLVRRLPTVAAVTYSTWVHAQTDAGPGWIGAPGVWDGSAVPGGAGSMGEGVLVGILDTGINMDHPSFAAVGDDDYQHVNPFGPGNYKGFCNPEHPLYDPARWSCNDKLVGAWSWPVAGNDPEDDGGHGTHTASTTAGNFVHASLQTPTTAITLALQGVAPHANIISYDMAVGGWATIATMAAAIDQSVDDGVEVLNMSFGPDGTEADPWYENHLYGQAYLNAQAAGVLVSVSAGNSGPTAGTSASIAPWMSATAASTHNRVVQNGLTEFSGGDLPAPPDLFGKGMTGGYGPAPIVTAAGRLKADGSPDDGRCLEPFPAGTFANAEIVVCVRGVIARTAKGDNVRVGGAGGMVLVNSAAEGEGTTGDAHSLPAVHLGYNAAQLLSTWMASGSLHMARIIGMSFNRDQANGDIMAGFSSRGPTWMKTCCLRPSNIGDWEVGGFFGKRSVNLLKPDVTAPGVDIWAAWATDAADPADEPEYVSISGTSMASPHHAGAMALMRAVHADWSVNEIRSALMTTAVTEGVRIQDGVTPAGPFDMGAGRINVSFASGAGFVLDEEPAAMAAASPLGGGDTRTLNLASMADFSCVGTCTWTRTLKGTLERAVEWTAAATGEGGLALTVVPATFSLALDETATITVTANTDGVLVGEYAFGRVDFMPDSTEIPAAHMPVAVRSAQIALPPSVISEVPTTAVLRSRGPIGSATLAGWMARDVRHLAVESGGFVLADVGRVELQGHADLDPFTSVTTTVTSFLEVAADSPRLVAEISKTSALNVNLYVGRDANGDDAAQEDEAVCSSVGGVWTELCDIRNPEPGSWWVLVNNAGPSEAGAYDSVTYHYGAVDPTEPNDVHVVGPESVAQGTAFDITVTWNQAPDALIRAMRGPTFELAPTARYEPGGVIYGSFSLVANPADVLVTVGVDILFGGAHSLYLPATHFHEPAPPPTPIPYP